MISKEFLSEILELDDNNAPFDIEITKNTLVYKTNCQIIDKYINIYELAYLCKKWAHNKRVTLWSCIDNDNSCICRVNSLNKEEFYADTELLAIVKACEWIIKI